MQQARMIAESNAASDHESTDGDRTSRSTSAGQTSETGKSPTKTAASGTLTEILVRNPEFQNAQAKLYRSGLGLAYGRFYQSLKLSPAQIVAFENAMSDYMQTHLETAAVVSENGMASDDPKLAALLKSPLEKLNAELKSAIGERGMMGLGPYDQATGARDTVGALAGNLYYTDLPLSAAQADQLTKIVAANTGEMAAKGLRAAPRQVNWTTVLSQAEGVLAPAQLTVLRSLGDKARYQQEIDVLAQAAPREANQNKP
jgi:hypothetical protein